MQDKDCIRFSSGPCHRYTCAGPVFGGCTIKSVPDDLGNAAFVPGDIAARQGLRIPLVYNSGGYDGSPEALPLLVGIIDIVKPDMKYGDSSIARNFSNSNSQHFRPMRLIIAPVRASQPWPMIHRRCE